MNKETEELIAGLANQSPQAQQQLLRLYGRMVFAQIVRMVTRQEDAEEIYQDVFVKVFGNIASYNESEALLSTWINRIAYYESISFLRKKKDKLMYVDDRAVNFDSILEEQVDDALDNGDEQTIFLIERALKFIPPSEQAIVTMFYFDDMSIKDIAYITESTSTAVAQRLSRTRKKLYHVIKSLQNDDR